MLAKSVLSCRAETLCDDVTDNNQCCSVSDAITLSFVHYTFGEVFLVLYIYIYFWCYIFVALNCGVTLGLIYAGYDGWTKSIIQV